MDPRRWAAAVVTGEDGADEGITQPDRVEERSNAAGPGVLRQLWWRICLEPYGASLRTPGASFWIFSARIAIFIMAAAEAISWSYLGYYIGEASQPYLTAAVAGLAVFSVIWIIDASFITLDTSRARDERILLGHEPGGAAAKLRVAAGLLVRVAIISATLFISAPFLAQLVFFRDISAEMNRRDAARIAAQRNRVAESFDGRIAALLDVRRELDAASISEAAGTAGSRRMGRGPAVATIEKRLEDVARDVTAVRAEKERALSAFDALSRPELQQRYGIAFTEDGIRARADVLSQLGTQSSYANAEMAIRGFLAFLFLALIVLKLFQPASVGVYFSETLQDLYTQYRRGAFDGWLAPEEVSQRSGAMTPLRFRDWCFSTYRSIRAEDEQQRRVGRLLASRRMKEAELAKLRRSADAEWEPIRREYESAISTLTSLQDATQKLAHDVETRREELAAQEAAAASLAATLRSGVDGTSFVRAVDAHATLEHESATTRARVRALEAELESARRQSQLQQERVDALRARLATREEVVGAIERQLAALTRESASAIGTVSG